MTEPASAITPLALLCGGGQFPLAVADAVSATGRKIFIVGVRGAADPAIARYPHAWIGMGKLGRFLKLVRAQGATDVLLVGTIPRPSRKLDFVPDLCLFLLMFRMLGSGDNRLLTLLTSELEREGLKIRGVHEVAPGLILPVGPLGRHAPVPEAEDAASLGFQVLDDLGPYDIGQSAVVADKRVVAIEAAEGTDLMLERVADLQLSGRLKFQACRSVLVKAAKRSQDLRLDTPAIGVETVHRAKRAGLAGIAVAAGQVMTPDIEVLTSAADDAGLFVMGVDRGP